MDSAIQPFNNRGLKEKNFDALEVNRISQFTEGPFTIHEVICNNSTKLSEEAIKSQ